MHSVLAFLVIPAILGSAPTAEDILTAVASNSAIRHASSYSCRRQYSLSNVRFGKSASATVRMTSDPATGKQFAISDRYGTGKLLEIIDSLVSTEADASRPAKARAHEIGPSNYQAVVRGSEMLAGHDCWVLALTPKTKSKYLIHGLAWVDKRTHEIVRLDGTPAASVSIWVGQPHIVEDFAPVSGLWLPTHMVAKSNSFWLGESQLEIRYLDYQISSGSFY